MFNVSINKRYSGGNMIGFEILHYGSEKETIKCVESIKKNTVSSIIAIVDNASPDESGKRLKNKYRDEENIFVILSDKNLGFAKGNNIGYKFLKENFKPDFICCINNDTRLLQDNTEQIIEETYKEIGFGVLAPQVILKDGSIQSFNPYISKLGDYQSELIKWEKNTNYQMYANTQGVLFRLINRYPRTMSKIRKWKQKIKKPYPDRMLDVVLHGCFLVFSKQFIDMFDIAFNENTFMYREEELLYLKIKEAGLSSIYTNSLEIQHMEDVATNSKYRDRESKYFFQRENQIHSLNTLISEMIRYGENQKEV